MHTCNKMPKSSSAASKPTSRDNIQITWKNIHGGPFPGHRRPRSAPLHIYYYYYYYYNKNKNNNYNYCYKNNKNNNNNNNYYYYHHLNIVSIM